MPCQHHKDTLIEAAANGSEPQGDLSSHLACCADCRAAFEQEQALFASIDAGLQAVANSEVPASLLPRVRDSLEEAPALQRRWMQPLIFASVSAGIALLIFLMGRPYHTVPENVANQGPIVVPTPVTSGADTNPRQISPADIQIAATGANHSQGARSSTLRRSAASSKPEVVVPPDERVALARFVATLNERNDVATASLATAPGKKDARLSVEPLQIADMEIKPLEGMETEASDQGSNKR